MEERKATFVRSVTVNNNQNAMSSAALRPNDPVQIRLERRFKQRRVFYQHQEGAFDNIRVPFQKAKLGNRAQVRRIR
jgi:hypothetical protein